MERHQDQFLDGPVCGSVCFLDYHGRNSNTGDRRLLLIAIFDAADRLSILVDPGWRNFVSAEDVTYLSDLLQDLKPRAQLNAGHLFLQLRTLNLGPVVTSEVKSFNDLDELRNRFPSHFVKLL